MLTRKSGVQLIVDTTGEPFKKVSVHLNGVAPEDAVRFLCEAAGASYAKDDNGVYVLSHRKAGSAIASLPTSPAGAAKKLRRRIQVMKADPKAIYDSVLFRLNQNPLAPSQFGRGYSKTAGDRGVNWFGDNRTPFTEDFNRKADPASSTGGNDVVLPMQLGGQGGLGGGIGGGQGGIGGGGQGGLGGGGAQGGNVALTGGQGLVPAGISYISYDPTDNSFIVEGTDEAIQEFIRLVNEFDEAPREVIIKVEFVTTSTSLSKALGFETQYARGGVNAGTTPGTFARSGDPVFLNYGSGNVVGRMRAQLLQGEGKVVNAPSVRTLNNQPAAFFSTIQTTIFINQIVGNGNGSVIVTPQPVPLNISTGLVVAPRINGDGTITLSLRPQIQDFGQLRRGPDGQEIPDVLSQQVDVVARVKNDEPVVVGGLTRKSDQGSEGRVPILADLPLAGQFFRSRTQDKNNADLLIFVTAHIVEEGEGSGGG